MKHITKNYKKTKGKKLFHVLCSVFYGKAEGERGFGIVEMIVVIAVLATTFIGIMQVLFLQQRVQILAEQDASAYILARETMESVRSVRDSNWDNVSTLSYSTAYYPRVNVSDRWELVATNPGPVGIYTRWVEFEEVFRDSSDDIATSGTSDVDTLKANVFVRWARPGGDSRTVTLESYLTNWQNYR
ncbi:MAG: type II secretion system protein [Candidatus Spechtbacterales bacterium]